MRPKARKSSRPTVRTTAQQNMGPDPHRHLPEGCRGPAERAPQLRRRQGCTSQPHSKRSPARKANVLRLWSRRGQNSAVPWREPPGPPLWDRRAVSRGWTHAPVRPSNPRPRQVPRDVRTCSAKDTHWEACKSPHGSHPNDRHHQVDEETRIHTTGSRGPPERPPAHAGAGVHFSTARSQHAGRAMLRAPHPAGPPPASVSEPQRCLTAGSVTGAERGGKQRSRQHT